MINNNYINNCYGIINITYIFIIYFLLILIYYFLTFLLYKNINEQYNKCAHISSENVILMMIKGVIISIQLF